MRRRLRASARQLHLGIHVVSIHASTGLGRSSGMLADARFPRRAPPSRARCRGTDPVARRSGLGVARSVGTRARRLRAFGAPKRDEVLSAGTRGGVF